MKEYFIRSLKNTLKTRAQSVKEDITLSPGERYEQLQLLADMMNLVKEREKDDFTDWLINREDSIEI